MQDLGNGMGKGLHTIGICAELLAELFPESEPILERNIGWREGVRALRTCVSQCHTRAEELEMGRCADLGLGAGSTGDLGGRRRCYGRRAAIKRETPSEWTAGCCGGGRGGIEGAMVVEVAVVRAAQQWRRAGVRNRRRGALGRNQTGGTGD